MYLNESQSETATTIKKFLMNIDSSNQTYVALTNIVIEFNVRILNTYLKVGLKICLN